MSKHAAAAEPLTEWRRLSHTLWVGHGQHGPVGIVEQGRRFNAVDLEGAVVARCHDLHEAQALLEHLAESRETAAPSRPTAA
jgi:hypothetical protein